MQNNNKRDYSKENVLRNGSKKPDVMSKNSFTNTIQEPALNESGVEAKKRGF